MNLLLTYPKSGSGWASKILSLVLGITVKDEPQGNASIKESVIYKYHYTPTPLYKPTKMILLIRDPFEVIPSYMYSDSKTKMNHADWANIQDANNSWSESHIRSYCNNIKYYHSSKLREGIEKNIIYYEDLLTRPGFLIWDVLPKMGFNVKKDGCDVLYSNYWIFSDNTMENKRKSGLGCNTLGALHYWKLKNRFINKSDLLKHLPEKLMIKYLKRYI